MITLQTSGRFGNNVQQFINAIAIGERKNIPIVKYSFPQFSNNTVRIQYDPKRDINYSKLSDTFYTISEPIEYKERQRIATKYLLPILKYYKQETRFEDYYTSALFVHIRSGDLFKNEVVHPDYTQPPLAYYTKIFAMEQDRKILVFYEDDANPVVNALKKLYPSAEFYSVPLVVLITIFMNAQYIVNNVGTLIQSIVCFNTNVKKIYSTVEIIPDKTIIIDLPNYITTWKNTEEQRSMMLIYTLTDI